MRHLLVIVLACFLSALHPVLAQSGSDPGDLFVNAYMAAQEGEKAEQAGDTRGALSKFRYALDALENIAKNNPNWQPAIVNYRKQRTTEAIARVQGKAKGGRGLVEPDLPGKNENTLEIPTIETVPMPETVEPKRSKPSVRTEESDSTSGLENAINRMRKLQADLRDANAATERAEREKKELAGKFEAAIQAKARSDEQQKVLQDRADRAEQALLKAKGEVNADAEKVRALQLQASEARKIVRAAKIDEEANAEIRKQYEDRLKAAQAKIASLSAQRTELEKVTKDAPTKVKELEQQLAKVQAENKGLKEKLGKTEDELANLKESAKNVDKLVSENAALMAKLTEAQKQITNFKAEGAEKDQQIAALKKEVSSVKEQLAQARAESANFQKQMGDMQAKLEEQGRVLAQVKAENVASVAEKKKMQVENDILRGIVLRQQKEEAKRAAIKKLVLGELAKAEVHSKALLEQIDLLGQPVVKLTTKELALFKNKSLVVEGEDVSMGVPKDGTGLPVIEPVDGSKPKDTAMEKPPGSEIVVPLPPETPKGTEASPAKTDGTDLALNKPVDPVIPKPDTPPKDGDLPKDGEKADTGTLAGNSGQPNIPAEFLPAAKDGKELFEKGDYRGAEKIYEKVLAKVPNNLYILSNLGVVRFRAGKLKTAEEVLVKATKIAPEDSFSHCTLGIVYYTEQKYDEAVSSLTKALAINPKNATAHNYLGITAASKGWQEQALKELETATQIDPSYADAHFNLAVVYATQTPPNKEKAKQYYERAIKLGAEPDPSLENMVK
ncbi:MAG: tetratricopeptide repeat protein [Chthoniobacter sp.]|nr:tetratricopeptide repeat protein [Chthoniobacter sp.]